MPKVILIGPPGSGKSSVAKSLAKLLGTTHSDTDHLIEQRTEKKISEIFIEDGESKFREIEAEVVTLALASETGVLSLGGGAILNAITQQELRANNALIVFLDVSISQAAPRVGFNKDRPLLLINPRQQWLALMEKRRPIYESLAGLFVSTDNKKAIEVSYEIKALLAAR